MKCTFVALVILATTSIGAFGVTALILTLISLGVAVICDCLVSIVSRKKGQRDIYSIAVAGMIGASSFSTRIPYSVSYSIPTTNPKTHYIAVAVMSGVE
ncbi:MAG: RnfABCDGE type electron transport complex subunit D [Candidatus Bathyarchaeota archaeon]|nr:RnfABCDGE type electron transport complex subunit D [Candidatus Bathyarchaeota archaeon]MDH5595201.1 RnfABCDGE type electron transport complex subunit D [Candidatus Bathyarchaeota archaeon]